MAKVLDIKDLYVSFDTYAGEVQAVRGVSYSVDEGEVLAVVGESGCGKSVTAQTIMKLNPMPPARIKSGSLTLGDIDIINTPEDDMQKNSWKRSEYDLPRSNDLFESNYEGW